MNKKISSKKEKSTSVIERQFGVILEDINGKFDQVLEGHVALDKELKDFRHEMHGFQREMYAFRDDTASSLKTLHRYLSAIDEELKYILSELADSKIKLAQKAEIDRVVSLEKRIDVLEGEIVFLKHQRS